MNIIPIIGSEKVIVVDDEDYENLSKYRWYLTGFYAFRLVTVGNRKIGRSRRSTYMHRQIMNAKNGEVVDHINHDKLDNRKINLRIGNHSMNGANSRINAHKTIRSTSIFKGVTFSSRRKKWIAKINVNQRTRYIGGYDSQESAARAYNEMANFHFGKFALLNPV